MKRLPLFRTRAFTLLELLTVIAIIMVLAGLILAGAGYAQQKAARDRASAEISALSAALESYKADNGEYPTSSATEGLDPDGAYNATSYSSANIVLYKALSGDADLDRKADVQGGVRQKVYFEFKADMLSPTTGSVAYISDPFGNPYGYSTRYAKELASGSSGANLKGYNPTFDLWSTAGVTTTGTADMKAKRIANF